jgi:hypothetical protein
MVEKLSSPRFSLQQNTKSEPKAHGILPTGYYSIKKKNQHKTEVLNQTYQQRILCVEHQLNYPQTT